MKRHRTKDLKPVLTVIYDQRITNLVIFSERMKLNIIIKKSKFISRIDLLLGVPSSV